MKKQSMIAVVSSVTAVCLTCAGLGLYFGLRPKGLPPKPQEIYYNDLQQALSGEGGSNANIDNAGVVVKVVDGVSTVSLLKDLEFNTSLNVKKDITIDLNGKTLESTSDVAIKVESGNVVIKGDKDGSKVSVTSDDGQARILHVVGGSCEIEGGEYETFSNGVATNENPNISVLCESGTLNIKNVSITAKDSDDGVLHGVVYKSGTIGNIESSVIEVDSPYGLNSFGINNEGSVVLTNCTINGYANYTANAAKTDYGSASRGVFNTGTAVIKNCNIYGTHSGITSKGEIYIDGGTYEGYGHGGIYLSCEGKTSYIKNATFKDCQMKNNYIDDGIAGTNKSGAYIGGASNVNLYIDNCSFSGEFYPFVMRSSGYKVDGQKVYESNNNVYISNSTIDFDRDGFKYIRVDASDAANQKLYIGVGNNFSASNGVYKETNAVATTEDYGLMFPVY